MKIVVLDGYTLNPGDLDWSEFEQLGELSVHERTPAELTVERSTGAQAIITNKTVISPEVMAQLPELKYIGVLATGYNVVDIEAARARGITVTNIPGYSTDSVAQLVFALLLELCHHTQEHSQAARAGRWTTSRDFCFWDFPLMELAGKTIGIIGFGSIGYQVARIAEAFGMNVLGHSRTRKEVSGLKTFKWAGLDELLQASDVVTLHCPLTAENQGMINAERLSLMKRSALLINTARGPILNEADVAEALNGGRIAGAGLDVLSSEPPAADNPLLSAKNCIITPHIAWATREARLRLMGIASGNLKAFSEGEPVNVVS